MYVKIAKPIVKATVDVLSTMAQITPEVGKPYVKETSMAKGDVTGMVSIAGQTNGTISVTFTQACAVAIVKNMLGGDIGDILQDVKDAVGELTNMISGQARKNLAEIGMVFEGGIPTVVMGKNHSVSHISSNTVMAVPFSTEYGDFTVEICME